MLRDLARKMGLGEHFWDTEEDCADIILKAAGITFKELKEIGPISGVKQYRDHETNSFQTPSEKVELYSKRLEDWGYEPLPVYHEPQESPLSEPSLAKQYPLVLTNSKSGVYRHSGGRQISTLRGTHPEPIVHIHPETAKKLKIKEGDWVYIENKRGRIKQKANLTTGIDPRVISADFGWWFPEKEASELYGWAESNVNILTNSDPPYNKELGSTTLRGILCKVYKVT
jgi:anaerobic selenocysteine-containing dehydrogenase